MDEFKLGNILASFSGINNDPDKQTYVFDCFEINGRYLSESMNIYFRYRIQDDRICIYTCNYYKDYKFFNNIEQLIDNFPKWIEDIKLYCPSIRNSCLKSVSKCKIMKINDPKEGVAVISYVEYYKNIYSSVIREMNYISLT